jgi:aspartyl-tRNA(Asn)/glutamyl-tRNA(Gln) amidotransferase subunit B
LSGFALTPERLASLALMIDKGRVSTKNARQALEAAAAENRDPEEIVRERGWELLNDPEKIARAVEAVRAAEETIFAEAAAADSPKRRQTLTAFLVGKVLAATGGRADPAIARKQIEELIAQKQAKQEVRLNS